MMICGECGTEFRCKRKLQRCRSAPRCLCYKCDIVYHRNINPIYSREPIEKYYKHFNSCYYETLNDKEIIAILL